MSYMEDLFFKEEKLYVSQLNKYFKEVEPYESVLEKAIQLEGDWYFIALYEDEGIEGLEKEILSWPHHEWGKWAETVHYFHHQIQVWKNALDSLMKRKEELLAKG